MSSRILPDSTEKMVARAIDDYGENPVDVRYDIFAKLVSEGMPKRQAYQRICPDASDNTASCRASILLAHPVIRDKVTPGVRKVIQSWVLSTGVKKILSLYRSDTERRAPHCQRKRFAKASLAFSGRMNAMARQSKRGPAA